MPELPEVETVVRQLSSLLTGRELLQIEVFDNKLVAPGPFSRWLTQWSEQGGTFTAAMVLRLGKRIGILLRAPHKSSSSCVSGYLLLIHLRMTGSLLWRGALEKEAPTLVLPNMLHRESFSDKEKHLRARLVFTGGEVHFYDPRRFGTIECHALDLCHGEEPSRKALSECAGIAGLEPLSDEFHSAALLALVNDSKQSIKQWLLRQDRVLGIGNIYACEVLFAAQISPHRAAGALSVLEAERLVAATKAILTRAIQCSGTTFSDFKDTAGGDGGFAQFLSVYDREGEPCSRCRQPIVRCVQAQRSTFYCPHCQQ